MQAHSHASENVERVEAGIDWVTWTAPREGADTPVLALGATLIRQQAEQGVKITPLRIEGYKGEQGGGCAYGFRRDTDYLRISGEQASTGWRGVASTPGHPTRIDVQTTIWLRHADTQYGTRVFRAMSAKECPRRGRPPKRTYSQDNRGLWLGAVGTRTGRAYLRIYDKGVEQRSHSPGVVWRIELEAKQSLARALMIEALNAPNHEQWCVECCKRACRNVYSRWPLTVDQNAAALPPVPRREPISVEAAKRWLRESVRPTVERLLIAVEVEELLQLLGLDAYATADRLHNELGEDR